MTLMAYVEGADQLRKVARLLRDNGNSKALHRRLARAIATQARPIVNEQRASLAAGLPKSGGAAETISTESKMQVRTKEDAGTVTITDSWPGHSIKAIEDGTLRHPVYGNRSNWSDTSVTPGLLSDPVKRKKPAIVEAIGRACDDLADKIAREA